MSELPVPKSPASMFDLLHRWFGIGSSDEETGRTRPWHHERMVEIAKLKRLMASRRVVLSEIYIAAEYARRTNKPIHATWQVFALIPEAMREHFRMVSEAKRVALQEELADEVAEAVIAGEPEWAARLMRAEDPQKAIEEWRSR